MKITFLIDNSNRYNFGTNLIVFDTNNKGSSSIALILEINNVEIMDFQYTDNRIAFTTAAGQTTFDFQ